MTDPTDPQGAQAARLRAAHALLDERPSPAVRAAVLRAAADSVGAATPADAARAPRRRTAWWSGWHPGVAGATVAVGVLAIGIAIRVEHDASVQIRSETPAAPAKPAAREREPHSNVAPPAAPAPANPAGAAPSPASDLPAAAPQARPAEPAASMSRSRQAAPAPAPAPDALKKAAPPFAPAMEATRRAPAAAASATPSAQAGASPAAAPVDRMEPPASADEWLRRIVGLRRAGRDKDADDELARFRAQFPDVKVPVDAAK